MTTIIVDRKEGKVYSDSRATTTTISGTFKKKEETSYGKATKIYLIHGHIITGCGSLGMLLHIVKKFHDSKKLPTRFFMRSGEDHDDTTVLVTKQCLGHNYTMRYQLSCTNLPFGIKMVDVEKGSIDEDYRYTVKGSGQWLAIDALEQGSSPEEAIKIASKHDMYTDDDVKVVSL